MDGPAATAAFSYEEAFDRNLGWLTDWEQQALRAKRVAIAGMGGAGGVHLLTLARLGIGGFTIADFDVFDLVNFNRQVGATMATLGRPKVDVLAEMALDINPELRITRYPAGVTADNADAFLDGADLFVDGFDFFVLPIRRLVFARCAARGIPALTAAPIGMGTGFLAFVPGGMSFERYFRLEGQPEPEQYLRFLMGTAPRGLHRRYLVDPTRVNLPARRGPSTAAACQLCAGVVAVAAVKLLLGRGDVRPAPCHHHFDPYRGQLAVTRLRWGNAGPVQTVKRGIARRLYRRMAQRAPAAAVTAAPARGTIEQILDLARWAPSGDNAQPWRFRVLDAATVAVDVLLASDNVYEYRGHEPTWLSVGGLLESVRIAASGHARGMAWSLTGAQEIVVRLPPAPDAVPDPLLSWLTLRSVDRGRYGTRRLTGAERQALADAAGPKLTLTWHEGAGQRLAFARLNARATAIRLRIPETYAIHQTAVDWDRPHSPDGIPAATLGLDPATRRLMRWAMRDRRRLDRLNRATGTFGPALQMDYLPGLSSGAFLTIRRPAALPGQATAMLLGAGAQIQRMWLTASRLGLAMQPTLAALGFAQRGADRDAFTTDALMPMRAADLAASFERTVGAVPADILFMARVGARRPRLPFHRSVRLPLDTLITARPACLPSDAARPTLTP